MSIGPITDKILLYIINECKKQSTQTLICNELLSPIIKNITAKYYYHYIFILILQISIIVLLILVIYLYLRKSH